MSAVAGGVGNGARHEKGVAEMLTHTRRCLLIVCGLAAMLAGLTVCASAQQTTYAISGRVMDQNNTGLGGFTVTLSGAASLTAMTDGNGNFSFANLPPGGDYDVTPIKNGYTFNPSSVSVFHLNGNFSATFNAQANGGGAGSFQFTSATITAGEGDGRAVITVTRTGDTSGAASVDFTTVDDTAAVRCDDTQTKPNVAFARCDYATVVSTIRFAAGEAQKSVTVPIIDDAHVEPVENVQLRLTNPVGATLGAQAAATLTLTDNDAPGESNPVAGSPFFVRQQYLDFLSREPDQGGFNAYVNLLNGCPDANNTDPNSSSASCDRITVSNSFFGSQEFQLKGYYVFRFYRVAFDRLPRYTEIVADMSAVTGRTADEVFTKKAAQADSFTQRPEFMAAYAALSNTAYVNTLLGRYHLTSITTPDPAAPDGSTKVTLTSADLANRLTAQTLTRAQVLRAISDSDEVFNAEFNKAFVAMQYYGYLRRAPDTPGYNAWLNYLTAHPEDARTMVNGFVNSQEYRLRFGAAQ